MTFDARSGLQRCLQREDCTCMCLCIVYIARMNEWKAIEFMRYVHMSL